MQNSAFGRGFGCRVVLKALGGGVGVRLKSTSEALSPTVRPEPQFTNVRPFQIECMTSDLSWRVMFGHALTVPILGRGFLQRPK